MASSSPRRKKLLTDQGISFIQLDNNFDEESLNVHLYSPIEYVIFSSYLKAFHSKKKCLGLVLGVDTIVTCHHKVYGKPKGLEGARQMLVELSGCTHKVITSCCLLDTIHQELRFCVDYSLVTFSRTSKYILEQYIHDFSPFDKAGAYGIQDKPPFLSGYVGDMDTIIGLPLKKLLILFSDYGIFRK